jgi:hypothetical protein
MSGDRNSGAVSSIFTVERFVERNSGARCYGLSMMNRQTCTDGLVVHGGHAHSNFRNA